MTDAEREALVERIKQAVTKEQGCGDEYDFCKRWPEDCMCSHIARAALAVAEPVVRGWEREACAEVAEYDEITEPDTSGRQYVIRYGDPSISAAIRARGDA